MQKKAGRIKIRRSWCINPKTRIKKSKKAYSRRQKRKEVENAVEIWDT